MSVTRTGRAAPLPPDERRLAILEAVLPVVRTCGTDITTRELAEAAGVAEGTLFRVFDDKESLVREAVAAALDPSGYVAALGAVDPGLPIEERLAAVIRLGAARAGDLTLWMSLVHRTARSNGGIPDRRRAMPPAGWRERQEAAVLLVRAQLRRLLEPDSDRLRYPVDTAIVLLESLLNGTVMQGADRLRQGLEPRVGDPDLVDFFLHGALRPEPTR